MRKGTGGERETGKKGGVRDKSDGGGEKGVEWPWECGGRGCRFKSCIAKY